MKFTDYIALTVYQVGISVVVSGIFSFLGALILYRIQRKDSQQDREKLQKLIHTLESAQIKLSAQLTPLHQKRADVIAELYGLFVDYNQAARNYILDLNYSQLPDQLGKHTIALNSEDKLKRFFSKSRIFLPKNTCEKFSALLNEIQALRIERYTEQHPVAETRSAWIEEVKLRFKKITEEVPQILEELEDNLRELLGEPEKERLTLLEKEKDAKSPSSRERTALKG